MCFYIHILYNIYRIVNIILYAIQYNFVICFIYSSLYLQIPNPNLSPTSIPNHTFLLYASLFLFSK